jgi:translation initiation factor 1 (eIF-1/SUI1)
MSEEEFAKIRHDALTSLRQSAHAALEQKMRLGQYAVVIENGEVLQIDPEEIAKRLAKPCTSSK